MSARRPAALLALAALLGSCALGGTPQIALRGPRPATVLLLPVRGPAATDDVARSLLATAGDALRARGYYPVPVEVGRTLAAARGLGFTESHSVDAWAELAQDIGADAMLSIRVEQWDAVFAPTLLSLSHDLGYRLWDVATRDLLWELRSRDQWWWDDADEGFDDAGLDESSYLGPRPLAAPFSPYRDNLDVARVLHRSALAALPAGRVGG